MRSVALLLLPLILACGYRLANEAAVFGPDVKQIRVLPFQNQSNQPGLERLLADAIHEEFLRGGVLEPTWSAGAPLEINGVIRKVEITASALDSVGLSLENEVVLTVDVQVERVASGEPVWSVKKLVEVERFSASADSNVRATAKRRALIRLSSELASRIRDELFQTF
jgi:outer membrane lipopolysaccharide assembly protein LptE/RlpB